MKSTLVLILCLASGFSGAAGVSMLGIGKQPNDDFRAAAMAALELDEKAKSLNRDTIKELTGVPMPQAVAVPKGGTVFVVSANGTGWLVDETGTARETQFLGPGKDARFASIDFRTGHITPPLPLPSDFKPK